MADHPNPENGTGQLKKTALHAEHVKAGARMVEFAGWHMPVQYEGLKEEHLAVRQQVGLFDVSHMGEISVRGPKALETLQWLTTNDVSRLGAGQAQYSLFPNPQGGIVDDLIVYCIEPGADYLLCVNASNTDKDFAFVVENNRGAEVKNESASWGQIAVQGPEAMNLLARVFGENVKHIPSFQFAAKNFGADQVLVARTGYTGEDGAEVFVPNTSAAKLWQELMQQGRDLGVKPIGLGARDTLRTEMKYSLYGHEIDDTTNPYEAGLGWVVKPAQKDFIGKAPMLAQREAGLKQKLVGFVLEDKGIPRQGYILKSFDTREIGRVTSGTMSPSLNLAIGIGYVDMAYAKEGTEFNVDIRGRGARAKVVRTPFLTKGE